VKSGDPSCHCRFWDSVLVEAGVRPITLDRTTPPLPAPTAEAIKRVITRGNDACAKIGATADVGSRREVEAYGQLNAVLELLVSTRKGRYDQV